MKKLYSALAEKLIWKTVNRLVERYGTREEKLAWRLCCLEMVDLKHTEEVWNDPSSPKNGW